MLTKVILIILFLFEQYGILEEGKAKALYYISIKPNAVHLYFC